MRKTKKIMRYPGGDFFIVKELLERINGLCIDKCTFVEVFGGSGYISQNVERRKFSNIIYNDIDSKLIKFYKVVKENPERLKEFLSTIPYSRELHKISLEMLNENNCLGKFETAVLLFYSKTSSFNAILGRGFAYDVSPRDNEARKYWHKIDMITEIAKLWRNITIENLDFRDIIKKYDRPTTVFYADPPFVDRGKDYYGTEFSENDLQELAKLLSQIKGKFLLKLDEKTYEIIKDILPENIYKVEKSEHILNMQKVIGEHRNKWTLVLVSSK